MFHMIKITDEMIDSENLECKLNNESHWENLLWEESQFDVGEDIIMDGNDDDWETAMDEQWQAEADDDEWEEAMDEQANLQLAARREW